jgi:hypothetical protein
VFGEFDQEQTTMDLSQTTRQDQGKESEYIERVGETGALGLLVQRSTAKINDAPGDASGARYPGTAMIIVSRYS